ncbi:MAG: oligosaccharide flippase family protein [Rikenellaceae bacterium]|nr:oligosaccharide flippase family protein [Rikenellaceae bacterium]
MSIVKKLAGQTATYGLSTILVKFINYVLTIYLTRVLTDAQYGVQSYYYAFIPFGLTVLTMGLETGYFRFVGKAEGAEGRNALFNTIMTTVSAAAVLFFVAVLLLLDPIYAYTSSLGAGSRPIILMSGALIAVDAVSAIPYAKLRAENKVRRFVVTKVANVVINVGLCLFFYSVLPNVKNLPVFDRMWIEGFGVGYIFVANLVASLATIAMLVPQMRSYRPVIDRRLLGALLVFSAPLLVSGLSGTANEFIDRQLLAALLPPEVNMSSVGIYSGVMKIAALMYLFIQMYRFAAEPLFLANVKKEDFKTANAEAMKFFIIASVAIFLVITLYIDLFQYFIGPDFRVGIRIVPVLLLSNMMIGIYVNMSFWYKVTDRTVFAVIISAAGLVVTIGLNLLLIPRMGYEGSAWARLGCESAMVVLSYALNQRYYPIRYDLRSAVFYMAAGGAIYGLSVAVSPDNTALRLAFNSLLMAAFLWLFLRKERIDAAALVKNIVNKIKRRR